MRPLPEQMPDTWSSRALPFLRSAIARYETFGDADSEEIAADTGLDYRVLRETADRLRDEGYLDLRFEGGGGFYVTGVPERGLVAVQAWPSPESLVDRLLSALEALAEEAPTEEERSRARKALGWLHGFGEGVLQNAAGSALGGALG